MRSDKRASVTSALIALVALCLLTLAFGTPNVVPTSNVEAVSPRSVQSSGGFTLTAEPSFLTVYPGSSAASNITVKSVDGFNGTVALGTANNPLFLVGDGRFSMLASIRPWLLNLPANGESFSILTISVPRSISSRVYDVWVSAGQAESPSGGVVSFSTAIAMFVRVQIPGIGMEFSTNSASSSASTFAESVTVTGEYGFSGLVSLSVETFHPGLEASLNASTVSLTNGGSNRIVLTVRNPSRLYYGSDTYFVQVKAVSGNISKNLLLPVTFSGLTLSGVLPLLFVGGGFIVVIVAVALRRRRISHHDEEEGRLTG